MGLMIVFKINFENSIYKRMKEKIGKLKVKIYFCMVLLGIKVLGRLRGVFFCSFFCNMIR